MPQTISQLWSQMNDVQEHELTYTTRMIAAINKFSKTTREANIRFAEIAPLLPDSAKADEFLEQLRKMESQMQEVIEATINFSEADVKKNLLLAEIAHAYAPSSSVHHE